VTYSFTHLFPAVGKAAKGRS